jgi:hypothetical protein
MCASDLSCFRIGVGGMCTVPIGHCAANLAGSFRRMKDCNSAITSTFLDAYAYREGRSSECETIIEYVLINLSSLVDRAGNRLLEGAEKSATR